MLTIGRLVLQQTPAMDTRNQIILGRALFALGANVTIQRVPEVRSQYLPDLKHYAGEWRKR